MTLGEATVSEAGVPLEEVWRQSGEEKKILIIIINTSFIALHQWRNK